VSGQTVSGAELYELGMHGFHGLTGALLLARYRFFVVIVVLIAVAVARVTVVESPLLSPSSSRWSLGVGPKWGLLIQLCQCRGAQLRSERTTFVRIVLEVRRALCLDEFPEMIFETVIGSEEPRLCLGIYLLCSVLGESKPVGTVIVKPLWTLAMVWPQLGSPLVKELVC
jgi:hypothetical protein